ncbi:MAG: hypothetical protein IMW97_02070 [Firmicutes bacterium]|nr:hypothetical protein [Candidatus Fermentithermobacillaceae bacterium]
MTYRSRLLVVTGAGISVAAGIWSTEDLYRVLYLRSLREAVQAVVEHPHQLLQRFRLFVIQLYCRKPTAAHWALKTLRDRFGFTIATENRDDLHQKTGVHPVTRDEIPALDTTRYSALLMVGISEDRFSLIPQFRERGCEVHCLAKTPCPGVTHFREADCQIELPWVVDSLPTTRES